MDLNLFFIIKKNQLIKDVCVSDYNMIVVVIEYISALWHIICSLKSLTLFTMLGSE